MLAVLTLPESSVQFRPGHLPASWMTMTSYGSVCGGNTLAIGADTYRCKLIGIPTACINVCVGERAMSHRSPGIVVVHFPRPPPHTPTHTHTHTHARARHTHTPPPPPPPHTQHTQHTHTHTRTTTHATTSLSRAAPKADEGMCACLRGYARVSEERRSPGRRRKTNSHAFARTP